MESAITSISHAHVRRWRGPRIRSMLNRTVVAICLYVEQIYVCMLSRYIYIYILCLADIYLFFNKTPCGGRTAHDCNYAQTRLRLLRKLLCGTGTARRCCSAVGGLPSSLAGFISPMSRSCVKDQGRHQNHPSQIATTVHAFGPTATRRRFISAGRFRGVLRPACSQGSGPPDRFPPLYITLYNV